jgi:hypothetical protein
MEEYHMKNNKITIIRLKSSKVITCENMYAAIEAVSTVPKYLTYVLPVMPHMLYRLFNIALRLPSISKEEKK